MREARKFLLVSGLIAGLAGASWAQAQDRAAREEQAQRQQAQKARGQQAVVPGGAIDLRREIASPVAGAFSIDAMRATGQTNVGGFSGNGFLSPAGQPSSVPGNPGTYQ